MVFLMEVAVIGISPAFLRGCAAIEIWCAILRELVFIETIAVFSWEVVAGIHSIALYDLPRLTGRALGKSLIYVG
jgi:hypothetical protein